MRCLYFFRRITVRSHEMKPWVVVEWISFSQNNAHTHILSCVLIRVVLKNTSTKVGWRIILFACLHRVVGWGRARVCGLRTESCFQIFIFYRMSSPLIWRTFLRVLRLFESMKGSPMTKSVICGKSMCWLSSIDQVCFVLNIALVKFSSRGNSADGHFRKFQIHVRCLRNTSIRMNVQSFMAHLLVILCNFDWHRTSGLKQRIFREWGTAIS